MSTFGPVYSRDHDGVRIDSQRERVLAAMLDASRVGRWLALGEIGDLTGDGSASISAQLRHLRKPEFGSYKVEKRPRGDRVRGLWEYQVKVRPKVAEQMSLLTV